MQSTDSAFLRRHIEPLLQSIVKITAPPLQTTLPSTISLSPSTATTASSPSSSSRILYDIPCKVCRDHSSGKHYGIFACDGCAGFFKRSIRRNRQYVCKAKEEGTCVIDKTHRNQCRACRLTKCQRAGMNKDAVQHERGPRNSTLRRQMALYFNKDLNESSNSPVLDLAMPKTEPQQTNPFLAHHQHFLCNPFMAAMARFPSVSTLVQPTISPDPLTLTPPAPMATQTLEAVCEMAARLLFMNVKWAKNVPTFTALSINDQLILLEHSWRELFVLGAAQFMLPTDLTTLLHGNIKRDESDEHSATLQQEVKLFQDTLAKFVQLHVDGHEFACLRAIVLFKTTFDDTCDGEGNRLADLSTVAQLQDQTQLTLNKYIQGAHPGQPLRFGKLLLLLPALKSVSNNTIEELFFRRTIGHIPIERIICDMYKARDV